MILQEWHIVETLSVPIYLMCLEKDILWEWTKSVQPWPIHEALIHTCVDCLISGDSTQIVKNTITIPVLESSLELRWLVTGVAVIAEFINYITKTSEVKKKKNDEIHDQVECYARLKFLQAITV